MRCCQVLDAPELADDYYLNLVDWSSTNVLGVGLGAAVYTWSASTSEVKKLFDLSESDPPDSVTSISWVQRVRVPRCPSPQVCLSLTRMMCLAGESSCRRNEERNDSNLGRRDGQVYPSNVGSYGSK